MAFTKLLGFEHLPKMKTAGTLAYGYGAGLGEVVFGSSFTDTGGTTMYYQISDDTMPGGSGKLYIYSSRSEAAQGPNINFNLKYVGITANRNWIMGFRARPDAALTGRMLMGIAVLGIANYTIINMNELPATGTDSYVELEFDMATGVIKRYVNGVYLSGDKTLPSNAMTAWRGNGEKAVLLVGSQTSPAVAGVAGGVYFSDFYFLEVTDSTDASKRQGPVSLVKLPIKDVVATGYTTSDGDTVTNVLNKAKTSNALMSAPLATSPADPSELSFKLDTTGVPSGGCLAIQVNAGVGAVTGSVPILRAKALDESNATLKEVNLGQQVSKTSYTDTGLLTVGSLDGAGFTKAQATGLQFKLNTANS